MRSFFAAFTVYPVPVLFKRSKRLDQASLFKSSGIIYRSLSTFSSVMASDAKKKRTLIGTHGGTFHCDEVFACYMLQQLDEYKNADIVRTRDSDELDKCDIVVDVGSVYDPNSKRYDHHQRTFKETFSSLRPEYGPNHNIRLSSAGLVYVHYGESVISKIIEKNGLKALTSDELSKIYLRVYENFVKEIDAIDNGVPICEGKQNYDIHTGISGRVDHLNVSWNGEGKEQEQFEKAKLLVGEEFSANITRLVKSWLPAYNIVRECVDRAEDVHDSEEIIEITPFCPWKHHLFNIEKELDMEGQFKYCLFKSTDNNWRTMCISVTQDSLIHRKFMPVSWRGTRNEEFRKICGVKDAIFCHANGFIAGAESREGALQLAIKSLEA